MGKGGEGKRTKKRGGSARRDSQEKNGGYSGLLEMSSLPRSQVEERVCGWVSKTKGLCDHIVGY